MAGQVEGIVCVSHKSVNHEAPRGIDSATWPDCLIRVTGALCADTHTETHRTAADSIGSVRCKGGDRLHLSSIIHFLQRGHRGVFESDTLART